MTIALLAQQVIERISAGEVIERPSSVVKELVENSLDAGASQITVKVVGGGLEALSVSDDGCGIPEESLETAFLRHATSKIQKYEDMFALNTLGFRGEALPSIVAVADVDITSCAKGAVGGAKLEFRNGVLLKKSLASRSHGTSVVVSHLFRLVPARLKFLKTRATESSHISSVVTQYAMAYPEVKFTLFCEGKSIFETTGNGVLSDVLIQVYGLDVGRELLDIAPYGATEGSSVVVGGLVSSPMVTRASNNYISLFVNRRWVVSRRLSYAVEDAYRGMILAGRHPIAVINITIPAGEIDVNIHPTKSEVKVSNEASVFGAVQRAIRQALIQTSPVPEVSESAVTKSQGVFSQPDLLNTHSYSSRKSLSVAPRIGQEVSHPSTVMETELPLRNALSALRLMGQLRNRYIVAEGIDGLYLIDQHAAHERVLYEKLTYERRQGQLSVQAFLSPEIIDVTFAQKEVLLQHLDELGQMGFLVEEFGQNSLVVRTVPSVLYGKSWKEMLMELVDTLDKDKIPFKEKVMALTACHSAVRFGQPLGDEEMRELLRDLEKVELPNTCPHGRPTLICMTYSQLKKEFKRT